MFKAVDQYEVTIGLDDAMIIPATLMERLLRKSGRQVPVEATDDGVLVSEFDVPSDGA